MLKGLKFTCSGTEAFLFTDSDDVYNYYYSHKYIDNNDKVSFVDDLFPGIVISEINRSSLTQDYVVCLCQSDLNFSAIDPERNIAVMSTSQSSLNIRDINVLLSAIIGKKLNLVEKSFLHCSVVEKNGEATVMLGGMGAGKTNLAVYLCRYYNYRLVCNDHAIVGIDKEKLPYVYCGTLSTVIRPGAAVLVIPEFVDKIPKDMFKDPWKTQFLLNPYFDKIGIQTGTGAYIKNIVFVDVEENRNLNVKKIIFQKIFNRNALRLYDALGEFTRCNGKFLFGINKVMPNFDNDITNQNRKNLVMSFINNTNVYEMRGSLKYVASAINELHIND